MVVKLNKIYNVSEPSKAILRICILFFYKKVINQACKHEAMSSLYFGISTQFALCKKYAWNHLF